MDGVTFCQGFIKSGINKGEQCQCKSKADGYCGRHQKQNPYAENIIHFVNNSIYSVQIDLLQLDDEPPTLVSIIYPQCTSAIPLYDSVIDDYIITYLELNSSWYILRESLMNVNNTNMILLAPTIQLEQHPTLHKSYKTLYEEWKKTALKALHLPRNIKKLSNNDTVKEMCDMTEYIDLPEEICERDYQLAGATYNPDDEYVDVAVVD